MSHGRLSSSGNICDISQSMPPPLYAATPLHKKLEKVHYLRDGGRHITGGEPNRTALEGGRAKLDDPLRGVRQIGRDKLDDPLGYIGRKFLFTGKELRIGLTLKELCPFWLCNQ